MDEFFDGLLKWSPLLSLIVLIVITVFTIRINTRQRQSEKEEASFEKIIEWAREVKQILFTSGSKETPTEKFNFEIYRSRRADDMTHWYSGIRNLENKAKYFENSFKSTDKQLSNLFKQWRILAKTIMLFLRRTTIAMYKFKTKKEILHLLPSFTEERHSLDKATTTISEYIFKKISEQ